MLYPDLHQLLLANSGATFDFMVAEKDNSSLHTPDVICFFLSAQIGEKLRLKIVKM